MKKLCILIPTYNEAENIESLINRIFEQNEFDINIIIINGQSTDGTTGILENMGKTNQKIHIINEEGRKGIGSALSKGLNSHLLDVINPDFIITMDGDLSHDPDYLKDLIGACVTDTVVIGSRYIQKDSNQNRNPLRSFLSQIVNSYSRHFLQINVRDSTSGYRCYPRGVLKKVLSGLNTEGYVFQIDILNQLIEKGVNLVEVPIVFYNRSRGQSKLGLKESIRYLKEIVTISLAPRIRRV
jgi:dolichol-phosphate mannosyltransferase